MPASFVPQAESLEERTRVRVDGSSRKIHSALLVDRPHAARLRRTRVSIVSATSSELAAVAIVATYDGASSSSARFCVVTVGTPNAMQSASAPLKERRALVRNCTAASTARRYSSSRSLGDMAVHRQVRLDTKLSR